MFFLLALSIIVIYTSCTPTIIEHTDPGKVNSLKCPQVLSANGQLLSVTWQAPSTNPGSVVLYEVTVEQYVQQKGTSTVNTIDLPTPFKQEVDHDRSLEVAVTAGVGE